MCLHYCASCCLSAREPIAQVLWQTSAATISVADTKHTVYQSQRRIFSMTVNLQHWLLRGKLSAQVVTGETILLNLQCNNVLRQTERKCGWWYNLTFTKSCSWKEQASHIGTSRWSWPLLSENISNKKFYNRGVIFFRFCFWIWEGIWDLIISSSPTSAAAGSGKSIYHDVEKARDYPILREWFFSGNLVGKTHTVMSRDGISVLVVEKLFRRIHLDKYHDYKVNM